MVIHRILDRIYRIGAIVHREMKGDACKIGKKSIPLTEPITPKNTNALTLYPSTSRIWWTIVLTKCWSHIVPITDCINPNNNQNNNRHLALAAIMQSKNWQIDFECKLQSKLRFAYQSKSIICHCAMTMSYSIEKLFFYKIRLDHTNGLSTFRFFCFLFAFSYSIYWAFYFWSKKKTNNYH